MANEDDLLGKIAIQLGLITPGQLQQLMALSREFGKPIGAILTEQGAVGPEDMRRLIELRKVSVRGEEPPPEARKEAVILARQLVREGLVTEDLADECLRDYVIEGERRPFQDILIERAVITREKAEEFRALREKRPMHCPRCKLSFSVKSASGRKTVDCPRCKQPLEEGRPKAAAPPPRSSVVEFKTTVMKAIDPDPPMPPPDRKTGKRVRCQCIICDALFEGQLETGERVKCPQCGSNFTPRDI